MTTNKDGNSGQTTLEIVRKFLESERMSQGEQVYKFKVQTD